MTAFLRRWPAVWKVLPKEPCLRRYHVLKADLEQQLADAEKQVADEEAAWRIGRDQLDDGGRQLSEAERMLLEQEQELQDAKAQIEDGEAGMESARQQIADGEAQLAQAGQMLAEKEQEASGAEEQLAQGKAEYASGKAEYEIKAPGCWRLHRNALASFRQRWKIIRRSWISWV